MAKSRVGPAERERLKGLIGRWRKSGRSAAAFAERHGLSQWALYYWAKRLATGLDGRESEQSQRQSSRCEAGRRVVRRARPRRDVDLIPVRLLGDDRPAEAPQSIDGVVEIQLRSGDVVRVVGEVSADRVRDIVTAVRQSC